jgi:hypothetical protein
VQLLLNFSLLRESSPPNVWQYLPFDAGRTFSNPVLKV